MILSLSILFILLLLEIPIGISLLFATLGSALWVYNLPLEFILYRMFTSLYSYPLTAILLFLLGGELLVNSNYPQKLAEISSYLGSKIGLRLGGITVLMAFFLSGLTGAAAAEAGALASVFFPVLTQKGYSRNFSASLIAAASTLGPIIPPSIPLIIYGVVAQVSITELFKLSLLPGVLTAFCLLMYVHFYEKKNNLTSFSSLQKPFLAAIQETITYLLIPFAIIFILLYGIVTVTEGSFLFSLLGLYFFKKDKKKKKITDILIKSAINTTQILFIIATASAFSYLLTIDQSLLNLLSLSWINTSKIYFLLTINFILLLVGSFLETVAAIYLTVPTLLPLALALHLDPLSLGIIIVYNLVLGMLTPPFGIALFVTSTSTRVNLKDMYIYSLPFISIGLIVLTLICLSIF